MNHPIKKLKKLVKTCLCVIVFSFLSEVLIAQIFPDKGQLFQNLYYMKLYGTLNGKTYSNTIDIDGGFQLVPSEAKFNFRNPILFDKDVNLGPKALLVTRSSVYLGTVDGIAPVDPSITGMHIAGHVYFTPTRNDNVYLQARRDDNSGDGSFVFRTSNASKMVEAMSISKDGNVGIGTIEPSAALDIKGDVQVQSKAGLKASINLRAVEGTENMNLLFDRSQGGKIGFADGNKNMLARYDFVPGRFVVYRRLNVDVAGTITMTVASNDTKTQGWMGTTTPHGLFIGTNGDGTNIWLDTLDNAFIGWPENSKTVRPNKEKLDKYDLFVNNGVLSEDYALGPRSEWADYVFKEDYLLTPLSELAVFIEQNKHLPGIPNQKEIATKGYSLHEQNVKLLEKIEELTLYAIKQEQQLIALKKQQIQYDGKAAADKAAFDALVADIQVLKATIKGK